MTNITKERKLFLDWGDTLEKTVKDVSFMLENNSLEKYVNDINSTSNDYDRWKLHDRVWFETDYELKVNLIHTCERTEFSVICHNERGDFNLIHDPKMWNGKTQPVLMWHSDGFEEGSFTWAREGDDLYIEHLISVKGYLEFFDYIERIQFNG